VGVTRPSRRQVAVVTALVILVFHLVVLIGFDLLLVALAQGLSNQS
jgi:hypothetical protein